MDWLGTIAQIAAIAAVVGGAFSYFVIKPLSENISKLGRLLDEMRDDLKQERIEREEINQRLIRVEERTKSNSHRIDKIEDFIYSYDGSNHLST